MKSFTARVDIEKPEDAAAVIEGAMQIYLHNAIDRQAETKRLEKQKATLEKGIKGMEAKLGNKNFVTRAKPEVVAQSRERLSEMQEQLETVEKHLSELKQ